MISGTIEILRGNEALDLSDLAHYAVEDWEGVGAAPVRRIVERGPLQHGQSDRGYRLEARLIQMAIVLRANSWAGHYAARQELLGYLSPANDDTITLRFTQPDGTVRQIDGYCVEGPDFAKKDARLYQIQRAGVRISCPDPAWYDPERQSVRAVGGGGGTGFSFPGAVPWTFGGSNIDQDVDIDYAGNWLEYPEIVINGPLDNARIENRTTGEVLEFGGPTIENGDSYTIDLRYGYKTALDSGGVNKISELTQASDLATWHIQPGINTINFSGENAGANTSMILRWYNRYLGV